MAPPTAAGSLLACGLLLLASGAQSAGLRMVAPGSTSSSSSSSSGAALPLPLKDPSFCHSLDCPAFSVVNIITPDVEERAYEAGKWVSTNVTGASYDSAVRKGFWRLFKYISGDNVKEAKIDMTAPVRVKVLPGPGPTCEDTFIISFFVPLALQKAGPPEPSSKDVYISHSCAASYYVLSYGGFTNEAKVLARAQELVAALDDHNLTNFDFSHFYSAGYDSPFRLVNRHNEIWVPVKSASKHKK